MADQGAEASHPPGQENAVSVPLQEGSSASARHGSSSSQVYPSWLCSPDLSQCPCHPSSPHGARRIRRPADAPGARAGCWQVPRAEEGNAECAVQGQYRTLPASSRGPAGRRVAFYMKRNTVYNLQEIIRLESPQATPADQPLPGDVRSNSKYFEHSSCTCPPPS
eukprot:766044-Hanusia_phi.AAC.3